MKIFRAAALALATAFLSGCITFLTEIHVAPDGSLVAFGSDGDPGGNAAHADAVFVLASGRKGSSVKLVSASFPKKQGLAKNSTMEIVVQNAGQKTIPNVSVTVKCRAGLGNSFTPTVTSGQNENADPAPVSTKMR